MSKVSDLVVVITTHIHNTGFVQEDKHLGRTVQAITGHVVRVEERCLEELKVMKPLDKYKDDWRRMYKSFKKSVELAKVDVNSRQLMVFNDTKFDEVKECFTSMQFVYTDRKNFSLCVYQRSGDVSKFVDDLVFFASVAKKFEKLVETPVSQIVIIYGNIHIAV